MEAGVVVVATSVATGLARCSRGMVTGANAGLGLASIGEKQNIIRGNTRSGTSCFLQNWKKCNFKNGKSSIFAPEKSLKLPKI